MWKCLVGEAPLRAPDTPNVPDGLPPSPTLSEDNVDHLTREGGDSLVSFLCSHTHQGSEDGTIIPDNHQKGSDKVR